MSSLAASVDRGLAIHREIRELATELASLESALKTAGLQGEQLELNDSASEGRQFLAAGTRGVVPVVFTADLLTRSFREGSPAHQRIAQAAGGRLSAFFHRHVTWETAVPSGQRFRCLARQMLGEAVASFVTACVARDRDGLPKNVIKVEWDRASETHL